MKNQALFLITLLAALQITEAAIITSVQPGRYDRTASWDCACIPTSSDTLIINHNIRLTSGTTMNEVTVNSGGTLRVNAGNSTINGNLTINTGGVVNNNSRLSLFGNYYVDGKNQGSGQLRLRGLNTTIDGSGEIENTVNTRIMNGNKTILSTAVIVVTENIQLLNSVVVTNFGTVECKTLSGNANRTWVNSTNATLTVRENIGANLVFRADSTGNTVIYNRTGTGNVNMSDPVGSTYYNLTIDGDNTSSIKRPRNNLVIENDLTINGSTFDVRRSGVNYNVNVGGDWARNGGAFNDRTALVTFDGAAQSINAVSAETFYNLTISGTGVKTLNQDINIDNDLTISSTLDVNNTTNQQVILAGDFTNSGIFEARSGTLVMNGTAAQAVTGGATFHDVTINNTSTGVTLGSGAYNLEGTLTLTNGNLATGNALTLISNASGTARIAEITSGSISGNITMQRYINTDSTGWRFLTSAVSGATLADWDNDMTTTGFTGSDFPSFPFVSIQRYDETVAGDKTNGYTNPSGTTDAINVGEGYWVWSGDTINGTDPFTVDVTGPANTGTINLPVTYTDDMSQPATEDGWNLVGNPYPSSIDWDDADWTKTNINDAIYIWDTDAQQFAAYVGGVGTNGGTNIIPSSQAFWVQADGSPTLTVREGVKSATDQSFLRVRRVNALRMEIVGSNNKRWKDEAVLAVNHEATDAFDAGYDALKLYTTNAISPSIAFDYQNKEYAINTLGNLSKDMVVPVKVLVGISGDYSINFSNQLNDPSVACMQLQDLLTGSFHDVKNNSTYNFYISDTTKVARFLLHIGASPVNALEDVSCNGLNDGKISLMGQGMGPWDYTWKNEKGDVLLALIGAQSAEELKDLEPGKYEITVTNSGVCGTVSQFVEIKEPAKIIAKAVIQNEIKAGDSVAFLNQSENAERYEWDFGDGNMSSENEPYHRYSQAGEYLLRLTALQGNCSSTQEVKINVAEGNTVDVVELVDQNDLDLTVYSVRNRIVVKFNHSEAANVRVRINNLTGQEIYSNDYGRVQQLSKEIPLNVARGVYVVSVSVNNEISAHKVSILNK